MLVTGDHAGTAAAVARAVGLVDEAHPVEGHVFARVEPEGKLRYITGWQAEGDVVAMTGDGVNDAPALRAADVGVAMGRRGTEVAKEAADLVLADDSLATVTAAIAEGRRVYDNVRRFVGYGDRRGSERGPRHAPGAVLRAGAASAAGPDPLGQPAHARARRGGDGRRARGSRRAAPTAPASVERGLRPALTLRTIGLAVAIAAACLGVATWSRETGGPWRTQLFVTLAVAQLALALVLRPRGAWRGGAGRSGYRSRSSPTCCSWSRVCTCPACPTCCARSRIGTAEFVVAAGAGLLPAAGVLARRSATGRGGRYRLTGGGGLRRAGRGSEVGPRGRRPVAARPGRSAGRRSGGG